MMTPRRLVLLAATIALLPACKPALTVVPEAAAPISTEHIQWIEVDTDLAGTITKCAIYHDDAERIPAPVRALAERKFPSAKGRFYETELYAEWGVVFEVEVETREGQHCELAARADGTELYTECRLDTDRLPARVVDAVAALLPGGSIIEAESKQGPGLDEIDVEVQLGKDRHYVRVARDGSILQHLVRLRGAVVVEPAEE